MKKGVASPLHDGFCPQPLQGYKRIGATFRAGPLRPQLHHHPPVSCSPRLNPVEFRTLVLRNLCLLLSSGHTSIPLSLLSLVCNVQPLGKVGETAFLHFSLFQIHTISTVCARDPFSISKVRSQASSFLEVLIFFFFKFNDAAEVGASYPIPTF